MQKLKNSNRRIQCPDKMNEIVQTRTKRWEKSRRRTHKQLYWFTLPQGLHPVFIATLARKIPLTTLNCTQLQSWTLVSPCKITNHFWITKLTPCSPKNLDYNNAKPYSITKTQLNQRITIIQTKNSILESKQVQELSKETSWYSEKEIQCTTSKNTSGTIQNQGFWFSKKTSLNFKKPSSFIPHQNLVNLVWNSLLCIVHKSLSKPQVFKTWNTQTIFKKIVNSVMCRTWISRFHEKWIGLFSAKNWIFENNLSQKLLLNLLLVFKYVLIVSRSLF